MGKLIAKFSAEFFHEEDWPRRDVEIRFAISEKHGEQVEGYELHTFKGGVVDYAEAHDNLSDAYSNALGYLNPELDG
jgi:hypothetical protein